MRKGIFLALCEVITHPIDFSVYERLGVGEWDTTPGKHYPFETTDPCTIKLI